MDTQIVDSERSVSPVIGALLIIGITVTIALVASTMFVSSSETLSDSSGAYDVKTSGDVGAYKLDVDGVSNPDEVAVVVNGEEVRNISDVSAGDSIYVTGVESGDSIQLVEKQNDGSSAVVFETESTNTYGDPSAPNAVSTSDASNSSTQSQKSVPECGPEESYMVAKDGSGDFTRISNAVQNASADCTIYVMDEVYDSAVVTTSKYGGYSYIARITKPLTIKGIGKPTLDGNDADTMNGFVVNDAEDVTIDGFKFKNFDNTHITLRNSRSVTITNVDISETIGQVNNQGIYMYDNRYVTIRDVTSNEPIYVNYNGHVKVKNLQSTNLDGGRAGVTERVSRNVSVVDASITNAKYGVLSEAGSDILIKDSSIQNTEVGIQMQKYPYTNWYGDNKRINNVVIKDTQKHGVHLGQTNGVEITDSRIIRTGQSGSHTAIYNTKSNGDVTIANSVIHDNPTGHINNQDTVEIDASTNWWGESPPDSSKFTGNVKYSPWCTDSQCSNTAS